MHRFCHCPSQLPEYAQQEFRSYCLNHARPDQGFFQGGWGGIWPPGNLKFMLPGMKMPVPLAPTYETPERNHAN